MEIMRRGQRKVWMARNLVFLRTHSRKISSRFQAWIDLFRLRKYQVYYNYILICIYIIKLIHHILAILLAQAERQENSCDEFSSVCRVPAAAVGIFVMFFNLKLILNKYSYISKLPSVCFAMHRSEYLQRENCWEVTEFGTEVDRTLYERQNKFCQWTEFG